MKVPAPHVRLGDSVRRLGRTTLLTLAGFCLAAVAAFAQEGDDDLDEIARYFGAQGQAVEAIKKLGGKVAYEREGRVKRVIAVDLSNSRVADSDMPGLRTHLRNLPDLASVDFSDTGLTDVGFAQLHGLTKVSRLDVAGARITEEGVARLRKNVRSHVSLRPRDRTYFPDGAIHPGRDDFLVRWYSEDLFAMREPSLWALSREDPGAVAFRFTYLPSFRRPLAVRVIPAGDSATLHAVRLDAVSGYAGGKPTDRRTVKLSEDQWAGLKRLVNDAGFWTLPNEMWTSGVADGAGYVFEGIEGGKYHVVIANNNPRPDDRYRRYKALCEEMIKLSGNHIKDF